MTDKYFKMKTRDIALIAVAILTSVAAPLMINAGMRTLVKVEMWTAYLNIPVFLVAAYSIYQFKDVWGGEVARGLTLASSGLAIQMLVWLPHIKWHMIGLTQKTPTPAPSILSLSGSSWLVFFHLTGPLSMVLTAYGFYQLYQVYQS